MSSKDDEGAEAVLGCFFALFVLWPIAMLEEAVIARSMWRWFVTPMLHVQPPSFLMTIGLFLFIGLILYRPSSGRTKSDHPIMEAIFSHLVVPAGLWLMAWMVHLIA